MARLLSHGTPSRAKRYLVPGRARLAVWSAVAGIVGLVVGFGLHVTGAKRVASPGDVARGHANIDTSCVQCHNPSSATSNIDLRCERCHDPVDSRRYGTAAHAVVMSGDAWHAAKASPEPCATCHVDHRGQDNVLKRVDDRQCSTCHGFGSLRGHPEFAVRRAQRGPDEGMDFSHDVHIREISKIGGDRCLSCHQTSQDLRGYDPINFDMHCSRCHIKDNVLTLDGTHPLQSTPVFADLVLRNVPGAATPVLSAPDGRNRVTFTSVGHRDPWVRANMERLSRTLDPAPWFRERSRLTAEKARLSAIVNAVALSAQPESDLEAWRDALGGEGGNAEIAAIAAALDPRNVTLAAQPAAPAVAPQAPADAASVEQRKRELQQLLDALAARGGGDLAPRVEALKKRLAAIGPESTNPQAEPGAIAERLDDVDSALRAAQPLLRGEQLTAIEAARDAVRTQVVGTLDQAAYDARRRDLIAQVERLPAESIGRGQVADLRAAVLALPDRTGAPSTVDRARDRARLLERIAIELEVRREPLPTTALAGNTERQLAMRELQKVNDRIAELDAMAGPMTGADLARAKAAYRGVVGACLGCHRLTDDETALKRTALNGPVMRSSVFSHKPHSTQTQCESCHASISTSKAGVDLNTPPLATCQTCHGSSARSDCAECHTYHPRSAAALTVARWP